MVSPLLIFIWPSLSFFVLLREEAAPVETVLANLEAAVKRSAIEVFSFS